MSTETVEFKTELKQLLDIIVHSLYSNREIFLRELISNACDAIDKLRFEALQDASLTGGDESYEIELKTDPDNQILWIIDNGIGMDKAGIVEQLGTIAKSGTKAFIEALKSQEGQAHPELIGQFGVGFYSAFMVADKVTVTSRKAGSEAAVRWSSDGQGTFTVEDAERQTRGTTIALHLKDDATEFLEDHQLRRLVKTYSDFVEHPVVMEVEKEEDGQTTTEREVINSRKAIWRRPKSEVTEEEYTAFYRQVSRDFGEPAKVIHYAAEGMLEFRALLFVPGNKPFDLMLGEPKSGLELYVQRVLIDAECEALLPPWMRFVKGVVESSDLPLNVSREMIQEDRILTKIRSNLISKVLGTLEEWKGEDHDAYVTFHEQFGALLKEGLASDHEHRDRIAELLLFGSLRTPADQHTTLTRYVEAMPEDQPAIYYLIGEDRGALERSPYLEAVKEKGWDVLLLTDPIDEWFVQSLPTYQDKPLQALDRGDIDAGEEDDAAREAQQKTFASLLEALGDKLGEGVKEVRLSKRLKDSAAVLVADEYGASAHMERLMARMGRGDELPASQRILELNGDHPTVQLLQSLYDGDRSDPRIESVGQLLYDQALVAEGSRVSDPAAFAARINELIGEAFAAENAESGEQGA